MDEFRTEKEKVVTQQDLVNKSVVQYSGRQLRSGGGRSPLKRFKGVGVSWDVTPSPFGDGATMIQFSFSRVQVVELQPDVSAYPQDTALIEVKHSDSERSNFGFIQSSINKALGVEKEQSDLDLFIGKQWEWHTERYDWGVIANSTNVDDKGHTWGDIWVAELDSGSPVATPQPAPAAIQQTSVESPEDIALKLLNGKSKTEWLPIVLGNDQIRANPTLIAQLVGDQWIASKLATQQVVLNADGTHTVK